MSKHHSLLTALFASLLFLGSCSWLPSFSGEEQSTPVQQQEAQQADTTQKLPERKVTPPAPQSSTAIPSANERDQLFSSCMKENVQGMPEEMAKQYCNCFADEVNGNAGISPETKSKLVEKWTVDAHVATGIPKEGGQTQEQSEALGELLGVYMTCLSMMM